MIAAGHERNSVARVRWYGLFSAFNAQCRIMPSRSSDPFLNAVFTLPYCVLSE